jgi:hypothetical protein
MISNADSQIFDPFGIILLVGKTARSLDTFGLLVDVVVQVWGCKVWLIPVFIISKDFVSKRSKNIYPILINVVIPAPFAPRFWTDILGLN